jgi:hypothetical protein
MIGNRVHQKYKKYKMMCFLVPTGFDTAIFTGHAFKIPTNSLLEVQLNLDTFFSISSVLPRAIMPDTLVSHVTLPPTPGLGSENINILLCIFFG